MKGTKKKDEITTTTTTKTTKKIIIYTHPHSQACLHYLQSIEQRYSK